MAKTRNEYRSILLGQKTIVLADYQTLTEYRSILLGQKIVVLADHNNPKYNDLNTKCSMHWRAVLEEYSP